MTTTNEQLKVALAQPLVVPGDCAENIRRMLPLVEAAASQGAKLIVFSEGAITGYDLNGVGMDAALAADDPLLDRIGAMAADHDLTIVAGLFERAAGLMYNSAIAFKPDGSRVVQRKHNVIALELESGRVTIAPRERILFDIEGYTCAMLICADSGIPGIFEELAGQGCNLALLSAAGLGTVDWAFRLPDLADPERRAAYMKAAHSVAFPEFSVDLANRLHMAIAAVNQCGWVEATGFFHPGHSSLVDCDGKLSALIPGRMIAEHVQADLAVGTVHKAA